MGNESYFIMGIGDPDEDAAKMLKHNGCTTRGSGSACKNKRDDSPGLMGRDLFLHNFEKGM